MNIYLLFKLIHVTAVILFLGNVITGLFWMKFADKTKNISLISFTIKGIISSDKWFTIPGVIVITASGIATAIYGSIPMLRTGWIFWPIVLFTLSGIIFSIKLAPLQKKIYKLTLVNASDFRWDNYKSTLKQWEIWGFLATLIPVIAMVMMVLKIPIRSIF